MSRVLALALVAGALVACSPAKKKEGGGPAAPPIPKVDTHADEAQIGGSWIGAIRQDPAPLVTLAQSSEGWQGFFRNDPVAALDVFERDAKKGDAGARIGLGRSALELAAAHAALGDVVAAVTPALMKAQATRPEADKSKAWRDFVLARLEARGGKKPEPAAAPPEGTTPAYAARLEVKEAVEAGRVREARVKLDRIDPKTPDLVFGEGEQRMTYRDPVAADVAARVYAALAAEALAEANGWDAILLAEASLELGKPAAAVTALEALLKAPPGEPTLAQLVLSPALNAEDLKAYAGALLARSKCAAGDAAGGKAAASGLPVDSIGRRVFKAWAQAGCGEKPDPGAFPDDRGALSRAVIDALGKLPKGDGANDVSELQLVERYVDAVQRLFASALREADMRPEAVRAIQAAEDKTKAAEPSMRNALSSLAHTARDYVGVGQPRVALKYLTRMGERLPAVAGAAEMIRDVLSLKAMEQGGGAAAGQ